MIIRPSEVHMEMIIRINNHFQIRNYKSDSLIQNPPVNCFLSTFIFFYRTFSWSFDSLNCFHDALSGNKGSLFLSRETVSESRIRAAFSAM